MKQLFNACFPFMISEKEENYSWAINLFREYKNRIYNRQRVVNNKCNLMNTPK